MPCVFHNESISQTDAALRSPKRTPSTSITLTKDASTSCTTDKNSISICTSCPTGPAIVSGLTHDLATDPATLNELHQTVLKHSLVVIKDGHKFLRAEGVAGGWCSDAAVPQNLLEFARRVVEVDGERDPAMDKADLFEKDDPSCPAGLPQVRVLGKEGEENFGFRTLAGVRRVEETNRIGREWHTDGLGITFLFAHQLPGGRAETSAAPSPAEVTSTDDDVSSSDEDHDEAASAAKTGEDLKNAKRLKIQVQQEQPKMIRHTCFVDGEKLLTEHTASVQKLIKTLVAVSGPDLTCEGTVAKAMDGGAVMNKEGTMLMAHADPAKLTPQQLSTRAKGWEGAGKADRWAPLNGKLIKYNPLVGKEMPWVNPMHLVRFETEDPADLEKAFEAFGIDASERVPAGTLPDHTKPTPDALLLDAILQPGINKHCYEHTWSEGDLVIFDNRGLLHSAAPLVGVSLPHMMLQTFIKTTTKMEEV